MKRFILLCVVGVISWTSSDDLMAVQAPVSPESKKASVQAEITETTRELQRLERSREQFQQELLPSPLEANLAAELQKLDAILASKQVAPDDGIITQLASRRIDLILELEGLKLRRELIEKEQKQRKQLEQRELQAKFESKKHLSDLYNERLNRIKLLYENGTTTQDKVENAKSEALVAQSELVAVEAQLQRFQAGDSELSRVSLELTVKTAQLELVEKLLDEATEAKAASKERDQISNELSRIRAVRETGQNDVLELIEKKIAVSRWHLIEWQQSLEPNDEQHDPDDY